jgi:hypothetical protein
MFGIFLNVAGRKHAEEGHELLAAEMSHRIKLLLAVASALTAISCRSTTTAEEMAHKPSGSRLSGGPTTAFALYPPANGRLHCWAT